MSLSSAQLGACLLMMASLLFGMDASAAAQERSPSTEVSDRSLIDINHATVDELCTLPGIGKKRAESIVEYRRRKPFTRLTQLLRIRGIGKRTLKRLKPYLTIGPLEGEAVRSSARARPSSSKGQSKDRGPKAGLPADASKTVAGCPEGMRK